MRTLLPAILISAGLVLQTAPLRRNAGGWRVSSIGGAGFQADLVNDNCWHGRNCVLLSGPAVPEAGSFGSLYKVMPPEKLAPGRLRFRAALRVEGDGTKALLWFRVDRREGGTVFQNSPQITESRWKYYHIDTEIPADARQVTVGFLLSGPGKAWIEEATFTSASGDAPATPRRAMRLWHI